MRCRIKAWPWLARQGEGARAARRGRDARARAVGASRREYANLRYLAYAKRDAGDFGGAIGIQQALAIRMRKPKSTSIKSPCSSSILGRR
jgi:hypothetical protein